MRNFRSLINIYLMLSAMFLSVFAQANPAPLVQDAYVHGGQGNKNFGDKVSIWVSPSQPRRGLIQFDLSSFGGTVLSATLTLEVTVFTTAGTIDVHPLLGSWNELVVTHNTVPAFDAG